MAEMGDDEPVTPEMIKAIGSHLRNSTGKISSSSSREKPVPHYLRASTGSCHDLCKYGRKHSFEAKERLPLARKMTRKPLEGESSLDNVVLPERKKTTLTQAKAKFSSISRLSEADVIRHEFSIKSPSCQSPTQSEVVDERKKNLLSKPRPLQYSRSNTANTLKILKQEASSTTRNPEDSLKLVFPKAKERKSPEKSDKILKPKAMKVKPLRSTGSLDISRKNKDSKMGKSFGTSKEAAKKVVASSTTSLSSKPIQRVKNLTATPRKLSNLKAIPLKTHNKIRRSEHGQVRSEEVQEKTLYVIKIENEEKPRQSDQNEIDDNMDAVFSSPRLSSPPTSPSLLPHEEDHDESEYTESEAEDYSYSEDYEFDNMETEKTSSGSAKGKSRNLGMLRSKEKDPQSIKLNFSRGRIIDIHPENNSPRRLKFRRGRVLGENQKVKDGFRKNFKRGKEVNGDTNASETAPESVVLRHQDMQGKKDSQGLFNNVIEETASKLVETRKSKVKALVGAFETVISLQDGKPSVESGT